jgi:hypothetical protein
MIDEMKAAVGQLGALRLNELRKLDILHETASASRPDEGRNRPAVATCMATSDRFRRALALLAAAGS